MPRGGSRPGAGRKSNAEIQQIRKMLDLAITEDDWRALAHDLLARARKGDLRAAQILLHYRFGDPFAIVPSSEEVHPIRIIEISKHPGRNPDGTSAAPFVEIVRSTDPDPDTA